MLTEDEVQPRSQSRALARPFAAIVVDWDGTAVVGRHEDATELAHISELLLYRQVWLVVITGANFGNIDRQFCSLIAPSARRHLLVCANRGSEVYGFDASGKPERRYVRTATPQEDEALTAIAEHARDEIQARTGLDLRIISDQLNRREIDLIPEPEWTDPPKSRSAELIQAVEARLRNAGLSGGIADAIALTERSAREQHLEARITSDVKHIEVGLTDKGDSVAWIRSELLQPEGIAPADVLIAGGAFGPVAGFMGSDDRLRGDMDGATVVSVGTEPGGTPPGVLHLGGGPSRFRALLRDQLSLRAASATQEQTGITIASPADRLWRLDADGYNPAFEHSIESQFATANGALGARAALALPTSASNPAIFVAGLFDRDDARPGSPPLHALVPLPDTTRMQLSIGDNDLDLDLEQGKILSLRRWLDMRRGLFGMDWQHSDPEGHIVHVRLLRFTSLRYRTLHTQIAQIAAAQPTSMHLAMYSELTPESLRLVERTPRLTRWQTAHSDKALDQASALSLSVAGKPHHEDRTMEADPGRHWTWGAHPGQIAELTQIISMALRRPDDSGDNVAAALQRARLLGTTRLLAAHERAWADRWAASDIEIEGDDEAQRALRFAMYHLISAANPGDEHASIGARGLTGEAYLGHVFWDTEIFMLPFYTFTWPAAARAALMYRYHTLGAARAKAAQFGYRGALYAWESADTGEETTPPFVTMPDGRIEPVHSGTMEHHISADIAYAVWHYWLATGDTRFLLNAGAEIVLETARFWSSRAGLEDDGRYHIRHVIGPDEYHTETDDNAYTNEMARWNIERGLEVAALLDTKWPVRWSELRRHLDISPDELENWRHVAERIVVYLDPQTGVIEQFAGFSQLEAVDLAALPPHSVPLDMLLGQERTNRSQVLKQADVVMLLALLGDRYAPEIHEANFRYYEPRCGHGSSLSPPIHALEAARLGDTETADRYLHQTAAVDLDDAMGNAALGVHLGALGGLWQAVALGMTGLGLHSDGLSFDPHVPREWSALRLPLHWHGRRLRIAVQQAPLRFTATLEHGKPLTLRLAGLRCRLHAGQSWRCHWNEDVQAWKETDT